jgi:hypothetical protein
MYIQVKARRITLPTGGEGRNKRFPDIIAKLTEEALTGYKEVAVCGRVHRNRRCVEHV